MNIIVSFFSGIIAAFTPCVIVLMPILLYRFFHQKESEWKHFLEFIIGFLFFYILIGYFLSSLFTSFIQNGLKVGIGLLFIVLGILAIMNKLNPINLPYAKNNYLLGLIFSVIVSFNPCTIPYLGLIISSTNKLILFSNLVFFGVGLIVPSIIFAIFGKKILEIGKRTGKIYSKVSSLMHYILIASGIYLIFSINRISVYDIYLISLFLIIIFFILIKSFFIINSKKEILKLRNVLLIIALFLILIASFYKCKNTIVIQNSVDEILGLEQNNLSCGVDVTNCEVCRRCIYIFSFATIIGLIGMFLIRKKK